MPNITEYKKQMQKGDVPKAYRTIMQYIMDLRTHFQKAHPDFTVSGSIYFGYMDMSYFAVITDLLKSHKLKIAIVFIHETVSFEVWLAAANKQVQKKYWQYAKQHEWDKYRIPQSIQGEDSILEHTLTSTPDFDKPDSLTHQIETDTLAFIKDIEAYLADISN